jgi:hypothetical protein
MVVFGCTRVLASDPNKTCAESVDRLRETMMDQSQMTRNMLSKYASFINEPFSRVASKIRKVGGAAYLESSIGALDESKLCDEEPPRRCYTRQELFDLLKPAVKVLSTFPDVYDRTLIFEDLQAVDYQPELERTTCHLNYFFDLTFLRQWFGDLGGSQADLDSLNFVAQTTNLLRATGKSFERKFIIQPNGRGGTNLTLLAN